MYRFSLPSLSGEMLDAGALPGFFVCSNFRESSHTKAFPRFFLLRSVRGEQLSTGNQSGIIPPECPSE